jgi:hypothetical protein
MRKLLLLLLIVNTVQAQKSHKGDKKIVSALKSHIEFLADYKLEGRRTGTPGELLAADYISVQLQKAGLGTQIQVFPVSEKRIADAGSALEIDGKNMICNSDFFPLAISASGSMTSSFSLSLPEGGTPWFLDISDLIKEEAQNVHADLSGDIKKSVEDAAKRGAIALFLYDSRTDGMKTPSFSFDKKDSVKIPVVYLTGEVMALIKKDSIGFHDVSLNCKMTESKRVGRNVFGAIWNQAAETVILGAHYDHLGYGEDKNSLFTGKELLVHNGADDNASGVAALIELAKIIKARGFKKYNYIFVAFSGEELGLFGSKYFADHLPEKTGRVNYMINMDMVGRLNDSSKTITIGGFGTSPRWADLLDIRGASVHFKYDSSGTGPSDHTSFYRKNIPVLFFFTGLHGDYHKPSDDAGKINYEGEKDIVRLVEAVVKGAEKMEPLVFTKTREKAESTKSSFRVTLGIMPDYTYSEAGVRVDGISEGRPAQKAGILAGDIILQLGDYAVPDLQKYMEALGHFNAGDKTAVTVRRGKDTLRFDIAF